MGERRAQAILQNPSSKLSCVVDEDHALAKEFSRRFGCDFYTDYLDAVKREDVNVVIVAVPNKFHVAVSLESIKQGKHVFCEKPLARNPEEARLMVEAALEKGVYLKAGSNVRFFTNVIKAKELIDKGTIGKILFMRGWIGHSGWNLKPGSWFTNPEMIGGGTLLDNGCHMVDLVRWFMGEVRECIGHCSSLLHELNGLEDNAFGLLTGLNGQTAILHSSWTEWHGYLYLEAYGDKGFICVDNRGEAAKTILKTRSSDEAQLFDYSKQPKESFRLEVDDFVENLLKNRQPLPSGYDGMRVIEIIHGLYESAKKGCRVAVYNDEDISLSGVP